MLQYYCIPSCDKCRKARGLLREKGITHDEVNMRKDGVDEAVLRGWIADYGLDAILNERSTTWRALDEERKAQLRADPKALSEADPAILKRPILDFGDHILTASAALRWLDEA